ncbi:MAG: adenylyl-sulfate kinase, partial [Chlorobi bacterium]|nr:adenylyl-sulfate kinase [Chlorobiota bacterium]
MAENKNIYPVFDQIINKEQKEKFLNQKAKVIWFTGLSGSGKTTLGAALEKELFKEGFLTQILDGDNIRSGI